MCMHRKQFHAFYIHVVSFQEESDEEFASGFAFAPKDITPILFTPKDNVHGLGYRGIDPKSAFTSGHVSLFEAPGPPKGPPRGKKKGMQGQVSRVVSAVFTTSVFFMICSASDLIMYRERLHSHK